MSVDRKNRTRRVPADSLSDAAGEKPRERAFFAPGHNDKINIFLNCRRDDFLRHSTHGAPGCPFNAAAFGTERGANEPAHPLFDLREQMVWFELAQELRPLIVGFHFTANVLTQTGKRSRMENN